MNRSIVMRKIIVQAFISLDGVMQAPGGPDEDPTGGFEFGGWTAAYVDEVLGAAIGESFSAPFDLLLGRKTYDIFAAYWPYVQKDSAASDFDPFSADIGRKFDALTKYVATHRPESLGWQNSQPLGNDLIARLRELKQEKGPNLVTQGSSELVQQLLASDLVDELKLLTYPVLLGKGKRLFGSDGLPSSFELTRSTVSSTGVAIASYARAGGIKAGSHVRGEPSAAELERRRNLR
jgi:dihydrofolate reductase